MSPDERVATEAFLRTEGVDLAVSLVLIALESGWSGKNWLPERFAVVANWLQADKSVQKIGSGRKRVRMGRKW